MSDPHEQELPHQAVDEVPNPYRGNVRRLVEDLRRALTGNDWTWGNTRLRPTGPEESFILDGTPFDQGEEPPASQRFAAMDPHRVEAAQGLLRDYPDTIPDDELTRRGLTLDDVSLVHRADTGDLPDVLPDITVTDPWRPPAAVPLRPSTVAPDIEHDDAHHDRAHAAVHDDVVPERVNETTPAHLSRAVDDTGVDPEVAAIRTAVNRLVDGEISEDDLARIGVTPEQYERLVTIDVTADIDRTAERYRAETAEDAGSASVRRLPDVQVTDETDIDNNISTDTSADTDTAGAARRVGEAHAREQEYCLSSTNDITAAPANPTEPDLDFRPDVIGEDIVVDRIVVDRGVYSADLSTPDSEGGLRSRAEIEQTMREADAGHTGLEIHGQDRASLYPDFDSVMDTPDPWLYEAGGGVEPDIDM